MNRVALLTPPGTGAIAVLAIEGPNAFSMARSIFRPFGKSLPEEPRIGQTWFGRMGEGVGDEVILAATETGIEVHCHGGPRVVAMLMEAFRALGCDSCAWPEFVRDEALRELAKARTTRTAAILLDQFHGAFARAWADRPASLPELSKWVTVGRHLVEPWKVVIAGAPNVGKSSLVNALSGYQRCIVTPIPGTTRDVITTTLAFDGWLVELSDTAGLRITEEALEREGIARSHNALTNADLIIWIVDGSVEPVWPDAEMPRERMLFVRNKADLPSAWEPGDEVAISAERRDGIDALIAAVVRRLVPVEPPPGTAIPFTSEWCDRVQSAAKQGE